MTKTKAETLQSLYGNLKTALVLPLYFFSVKEYHSNEYAIKEAVTKEFGSVPLIVRSSAQGEDTETESMAGAFASVLNVTIEENFDQAVRKVINSFGATDRDSNQILIQPMLEKVSLSGVAFSIDPNTMAPYRVVNYTTTNDTTSITGGKSGKTYVCAQAFDQSPFLPKLMKRIFAMVTELEDLFDSDPLDIEFAFNAQEELFLLQVRPLVINGRIFAEKNHKKLLIDAAQKVKLGVDKHPFLHGMTNVFGVMPDWNPAEIIGVRPKPLSLSLYRELITDSIWAYQRHNYGYKNLRSFPLLVDFHGLPYIDVRVSFNSFIPRDIEGKLADKLVDHYINQLKSYPKLHDKVEFEIIFSCYSLDLPIKLGKLQDAGFSAEECETLTVALRELTNKIIDKENGLWKQDFKKLATLKKRRDIINGSNLDNISKIYWLLEDCKRYGTLPFAGLARTGFIAVQILKSMVALKILSDADYERFMESIKTESSNLAEDFIKQTKTDFLAKYGHLRPGTYDITSARYDRAPEMYFSWENKNRGTSELRKNTKFFVDKHQDEQISQLINEHKLETDTKSLFEFCSAGIELRETAKFEFSANLSDAMSLMAEVASEYDINEEELSFAKIQDFYNLYAGTEDPAEILKASVIKGKKSYEKTSRLWMPALISRPEEVFAFDVMETEPNFITQKAVTAAVAFSTQKSLLADSIVMITNADPGYDWLFSHPIKGLITAYGGINSHMAIRAGELAVPAVIGAGEINFEAWSKAKILNIDCSNKVVKILS